MLLLLLFNSWICYILCLTPGLRLTSSADQIDKQTLEIAQVDDVTYTDMQKLAEELPSHSPRYILLSYPLTLVRLFVSTYTQ